MEQSSLQQFLSQPDHDLLIEVRTTLNILVADVKKYNDSISALELRVRAIENMSNKTLGGGKTLLLIFGSIAGFSSLILGLLSYFAPHLR